MNTATDREAGSAPDPLSWPMKLAASIVGAFVLAIAAVIALVVVSAQVGFYDHHLGTKQISFHALGVDTPVDLPTFTPLATEGVVWAFTLLAVVLVIANKTAKIWTQSMWFFATIAAVVNTWYSVGDENDLFGGAIRGGLSLAGPYLVHMFILWCRHLRSGKSLEQARADMEIKWQGIAGKLGTLLYRSLQHLRHLPIALRAFGYWLGVPGWGYEVAWQAASVNYRLRVQETLNNAHRKIINAGQAADQRPIGEATTNASAEPTTTAAPVASTPAATKPDNAQVVVAAWPAIDEDEIARLAAAAGRPETVTDQGGSTTTRDDHGATTGSAGRRPRVPRETTTDAPSGDHGDDHSTASGRPVRRPQRVRGRGQKVAGMRRGGRAKQTTTVDISDVLPDARVVAIGLGAELKRERLLKELRERGHSVGGQRRDALWEAIKAEQAGRATGQ